MDSYKNFSAITSTVHLCNREILAGIPPSFWMYAFQEEIVEQSMRISLKESMGANPGQLQKESQKEITGEIFGGMPDLVI